MRLRLVAFTTAWLLSSGFVVPELTGTTTNPSAQPEQRRFLGLDGDYLPFDTDDAILDFLSTAEIVSRDRIPVGVTRPEEVMLEKDGIRARATYKDIDERYERVQMSDGSHFMNLRDYYMFERAAYELAQMLGLDNVPPTVVRRFGRDRASLQMWIENSMTELDRANEGQRPPNARQWTRQLQAMYLFDDLTGNVDRNAGDIVIDRDSWKLWMIDHSRAFQRDTKLRHAALLLFCSRDLWENLQALDNEEVAGQLGEYLTPLELNSMFERRDALVEHIQALIDERGEDEVIFAVQQQR